MGGKIGSVDERRVMEVTGIPHLMVAIHPKIWESRQIPLLILEMTFPVVFRNHTQGYDSNRE